MSIARQAGRHCPAPHGAAPRHEERSMEYLLLIHSETNRNAEAVPEAARRQMLEAYRAYTDAIQKAGVLKSSNRLRPAASATSVARLRTAMTRKVERSESSA